MKVLDLGCGCSKWPGAIGVDVNSNSAADVIHDLNSFPYPFQDSQFDVIRCNSILEHLDDIVKVMEELYRIAKPGAAIKIHVPYFASVDAFTDPTHKRFFSARSFDYFTGEYPEYSFYSHARFRKQRVEILFWQLPRLGGIHIQHLAGAYWLANHLTTIYERFLVYWLPAQYIEYELTVLKGDN